MSRKASGRIDNAELRYVTKDYAAPHRRGSNPFHVAHYVFLVGVSGESVGFCIERQRMILGGRFQVICFIVDVCIS